MFSIYVLLGFLQIILFKAIVCYLCLKISFHQNYLKDFITDLLTWCVVFLQKKDICFTRLLRSEIIVYPL